MGPIVAAIQVITAITQTGIVSALIARTVMTIATQMIFKALTPKPKGGAGGDFAASGVEQQRQIGEATPRAIALGWTIVAGQECALWASGDGDDNRFNTRVIVISDWPTTLQKVWVRGRELTFEGDINAGWFACNQYRSKTGAARLWMRFVRGDWNQAADPLLISYANANASWTSEDRLRGVSALLIRREYDVDAFQSGAPDNDDLRVEVRNAPVYDWRDATQNINDVTTWKPSENPIVLVENALCLLRAPAQFSPGSTDPIVGPGLDFSRRPMAKLTAMANICDELVSGQPRYRAGGVVSAAMTGREIIDRFAAACAGSWVSSGDGGYLRPGHVPAPVMDIPAGALKANASDRYDPWARPDSVVNSVIASYPDPAQAWQVTPLPPATDAAWVAADGGVRTGQEDLSFCPYRDQAWRIAVRKARGARLMGARDFTGPHWLIELEPGDVVTAPDPALPYLSTRWWMVQRTVLLAKSDGLTVQLTLNEIDSAIDAAPPALGAAATFIPSSLSRALAVPPVTIGQRVVSGGSGGQYPELTFLVPDTASQASGVVQLQGPATANDNALLAAAQIRSIGLSRGLLHGEPVVPGWYRWRAAGRDVDGSVGAFDASWQVAVQVTAPIVAGQAGAGIGGKPILNELVPQTGNRVRFSNFEVIDTAWLLSSNNAAPITSFAVTQVSGLPLLTVLYTAPGNGSIIRIYTGVGMEATPGEWLMPSVGVKCDGSFVAQTRAYIAFYDSSGGSTGTANATPLNGGQALNTKMVWPTAVQVPASTVRCALFVEIESSSTGAISLGLTHPIVVSAVQGQTLAPAFVPGLNAFDAADVTAQAVPVLEGPASVSFDVDGAGALSPGSQVPRTLQFIRKRGATDVSTSTTWSIVSPVNVTLGAITNGGVNITAVAAGNSAFTVRSVRDGVTIDQVVTVQKNTIAAGVISATRKKVTSTAGTPNNGNWTDVASMVISATPTGNLFFNSSFATVVAGTGTCSHEARLTVDGVQVGAIQAAQATVTGGVPEAVDFDATFAQVIPVTAGSRTIAFQLRRTSGSGQITTSNIVFDVAAFPG